MTSSSRRLLLWSPRILGILVALFLGVFTLDALDEGIPVFLLNLAPILLLLLVVAVSWRWEWIGGAVFIILALLYGVIFVPLRHREWVAVLIVSGPLLVVGALFLWSWRHRGELPAQS